MWLYFGAFGTAGTILFTLVIWYGMKAHNAVEGYISASAKWSMAGYMFLFLASYLVCGCFLQVGIPHYCKTNSPAPVGNFRLTQ
jgi:hypothetical protein